jgi:large subunit ribosomal protein L21
MYAVIETGGKQFRVELGTEIEIDRLDAAPGETIELGRVLLLADGDEAQIGRPTVDGATVSASVVAQRRGDKIIVFKYQPKARRRVKQGHRQDLTLVRVSDIVFNDRSAAKEAEAQARETEAERKAAAEEAERKAAADRALAAKLEAEAKAAAEAEKAEKAKKAEKAEKADKSDKAQAEAKSTRARKSTARTKTDETAEDKSDKTEKADKAQAEAKPTRARKSTAKTKTDETSSEPKRTRKKKDE